MLHCSYVIHPTSCGYTVPHSDLDSSRVLWGFYSRKTVYNVLMLYLFLTVSIARRLQDPLAELIKIDPKNIGVGMYQVGHLMSSCCSLICERLLWHCGLIL